MQGLNGCKQLTETNDGAGTLGAGCLHRLSKKQAPLFLITPSALKARATTREKPEKTGKGPEMCLVEPPNSSSTRETQNH